MNCPHCNHEISASEVAALLGGLSAGVQKRLSDKERNRRSVAMTNLNKGLRPARKAQSIPAKKNPSLFGKMEKAEFPGPVGGIKIPAITPKAKTVDVVSARKADDPMKRLFAKIPMAAKPDDDYRFNPQTKKL